MKYKKIYHLSHIDLDGYGCQIVTESIFGKENVECYNCDYNEIDIKLENIVENMLLNNKCLDDVLLLITDLGLNEKSVNYINDRIQKNKINVLLLDHHKTNIEFTTNEWYKVDVNCCATKITQLYFDNNNYLYEKDTRYFSLKMLTKKYSVESFADLVNVYDLWLESHKDFNKATFLSSTIFNTFEFPNFLKNENAEYKKFICVHVFGDIKNNLSIKEIEKKQVDYIEDFIISRISNLNISDEDYRKYYINENVQTEVKIIRYIYDKTKNLNLFKTTYINKSKVIVMYAVSSKIFQQYSHFYLKDFKDVDIMMKINKKGIISLRSDGKELNKDVGLIGKKYFNGGGHFNAAGGELLIVKDDIKLNIDLCIKLIEQRVKRINRMKLKNCNYLEVEYFKELRNKYNGEIYKFDNDIFVLQKDKKYYYLIDVKKGLRHISKMKTLSESLESFEQLLINMYKE